MYKYGWSRSLCFVRHTWNFVRCQEIRSECLLLCFCACVSMSKREGKKDVCLTNSAPCLSPSILPLLSCRDTLPLAQSRLAAQQPCVLAPRFEGLQKKKKEEEKKLFGIVPEEHHVKGKREREREEGAVWESDRVSRKICRQKQAVLHVLLWFHPIEETSVGKYQGKTSEDQQKVRGSRELSGEKDTICDPLLVMHEVSNF